MDIQSLAIIAAGLLLYSLVSGRLRETMITAPLIFVLFGWFIGAGWSGVAPIDPGHGMIHFIAECTLILILFTDASRIDLGDVRRDHNLPQRMLLRYALRNAMPPIITVSWPFCAPASPPETGASRNATPRARQASSSSRASAAETVV